MSVAERFDRLAKQIAELPPAERVNRIEQAARAYAQLIDVQASRNTESIGTFVTPRSHVVLSVAGAGK